MNSPEKRIFCVNYRVPGEIYPSQKFSAIGPRDALDQHINSLGEKISDYKFVKKTKNVSHIQYDEIWVSLSIMDNDFGCGYKDYTIINYIAKKVA